MTLDAIAQKVVDDLEWSSSIPNIKAMVLTALADAVVAEREACAKVADAYSEQAKRERWTGENVAGRTAAAVASMIRGRAGLSTAPEPQQQ